MDFSVLMSVYKNTKISELQECMDSLLNQTVLSNDIVIVIDGEIPNDLNKYLKEIQEKNKTIKLYPIEKNGGLGNALRYGMQFCQNEIIARMDTDDVCEENRFKKQLKYFENDEKLSVLGSNIAEFINNKEDIIAYRNVPLDHKEICNYLKKRCPINHMTVMFKKSEVEKAGGYLPWYLNEDSYLWVRMYLKGAKFQNINENLVYVRVGQDMYKRRGGYKYFKSEKDLFKFMKKNKIISNFNYIKQVTIRIIVEVLMPNFMRQWFFKTFLRSK